MDFHEYNRGEGLAHSNYRGAKDFDLDPLKNLDT